MYFNLLLRPLSYFYDAYKHAKYISYDCQKPLQSQKPLQCLRTLENHKNVRSNSGHEFTEVYHI